MNAMLCLWMLMSLGSGQESAGLVVEGVRALAQVRREVHRFPIPEKGPNGSERVIALVGGALGLGEIDFGGYGAPRLAGVAKRPKQDAAGQIDREYWDKYELVRSVRFETRETVTVTLPFDFEDWYASASVTQRHEYDHLRTRCERERYIERIAKIYKRRVQYPWVTIEVETAWDSNWPADGRLGKPYAFTAEFKHCYVLYGHHVGHGFYEWDPDLPPQPRLIIVVSVQEAGTPEDDEPQPLFFSPIGEEAEAAVRAAPW